MFRLITSTALCCTILLTTFSQTQADEKSATAAIRKAGGSVRTIAKKVKSKEVALHLTEQDVTDELLANLPQISNIAILNLRGTKITDAGLAHVGKLPALTHLHLELTGIGDAGLAHLANLANLEYLNLYGTQVTDAGLEHLKSLKKLKKLYLWRTKATDKGAASLTKALPGINVNTGAKFTTIVPPPAKPNVKPAPAPKKLPPPKKSLAKGQFVRVRHEGDGKILSLAEVEIHQTGDGAALHRQGKSTQSSVAAGGTPERAIDGNTNQVYTGNSVTHTATEKNPWWLVDLGGVKDIGRIRVLNRADGVESRLDGAILEVLDKDQKKVVYTTKLGGVGEQKFEGK